MSKRLNPRRRKAMKAHAAKVQSITSANLAHIPELKREAKLAKVRTRGTERDFAGRFAFNAHHKWAGEDYSPTRETFNPDTGKWKRRKVADEVVENKGQRIRGRLDTQAQRDALNELRAEQARILKLALEAGQVHIDSGKQADKVAFDGTRKLAKRMASDKAKREQEKRHGVKVD